MLIIYLLTQSQDYVTEKFFNLLISSTVPIYLGTPNIHDFVSGKNRFMNIPDFVTFYCKKQSIKNQLVSFIKRWLRVTLP